MLTHEEVLTLGRSDITPVPPDRPEEARAKAEALVDEIRNFYGNPETVIENLLARKAEFDRTVMERIEDAPAQVYESIAASYNNLSRSLQQLRNFTENSERTAKALKGAKHLPDALIGLLHTYPVVTWADVPYESYSGVLPTVRAVLAVGPTPVVEVIATRAELSKKVKVPDKGLPFGWKDEFPCRFGRYMLYWPLDAVLQEPAKAGGYWYADRLDEWTPDMGEWDPAKHCLPHGGNNRFHPHVMDNHSICLGDGNPVGRSAYENSGNLRDWTRAIEAVMMGFKAESAAYSPIHWLQRIPQWPTKFTCGHWGASKDAHTRECGICGPRTLCAECYKQRMCACRRPACPGCGQNCPGVDLPGLKVEPHPSCYGCWGAGRGGLCKNCVAVVARYKDQEPTKAIAANKGAA